MRISITLFILILIFGVLCGTFSVAKAQSLTEITGVRIYEHHSPTIAGSTGANGDQSGYDFVNHDYYASFYNWAGYTNGEEANIDLVEHNGPTTLGGAFGFTSGVSTIWGGDIQGNGLTKFMVAPTTFDYYTITDVAEIANAFDSTLASINVEHVAENQIYLARIRNTSMYVAMNVHTINVQSSSTTWITDNYFDFDYKYGELSGQVEYLMADSTILNLESHAGITEFHLESNINWSLTCADNWLTIDPLSGMGNATIAINYSANESPNDRSSVIVIEGSPGLSDTVYINQVGTPMEIGRIIHQNGHSLHLHTNSTSIQISIPDHSFEPNIKLEIYGLNGQMVQQSTITSSTEEVILALPNPGIFMLHVVANKKVLGVEKIIIP